ncbi:MAG: Kelch repeat-containing protein, partial [Actinomycetota bacterium]
MLIGRNGNLKRLRRPARAAAAFVLVASLAIGALGAAVSGASSAAGSWNQIATGGTQPPGRSGHVMAENPGPGGAPRGLVVFGGQTAATPGASPAPVADTWVFNGSSWEQKCLGCVPGVSSPSARYGAAMAYDPVHNQTVLFGGQKAGGLQTTNYLSDTWIWNGDNWRLHCLDCGPSARSGSAMAFDPATSSIVMWGGRGPSYFSETWIWTGGDVGKWTSIPLGLPDTYPTFRTGHVMTRTKDAVLLFGGANFQHYDDTWVWDGTLRTWTEKKDGLRPLARTDSAMAFDPSTGMNILFGGSAQTPAAVVSGVQARPSESVLGDTWAWEGTWNQIITAKTPPPRRSSSMSYESVNATAVLFGGETSVAAGEIYPYRPARQPVNLPMTSETWSYESLPVQRPSPAPSPSEVPTFPPSPSPSPAESPGPSDGWDTLSSLNTDRIGVAAAAGGDGMIYAVGRRITVGRGSDTDKSVEAYDPRSRAWRSVASLAFGRLGHAAVTGTDGRVYAIGGGREEVEAYDPCIDRWMQAAPMLVTSIQLAATAGLDGKIYASGGALSGLDALARVEAYDVNKNQWEPVAPMALPRLGHAAATDRQGVIYSIGGYRSSRYVAETAEGRPSVEKAEPLLQYAKGNLPDTMTATASVEAYDPALRVWKPVADLPSPRAGAAATLGPDGRIYLMGGDGPDNKVSSRTFVYDPSSNKWETGSPMPTARSGLGAVTGADRRIYALGGKGAPRKVEVYNAPGADGVTVVPPARICKEEQGPVFRPGTWTKVAPMRQARYGAAAATAPDGRLYVIGGYTEVSFSNWTPSVEAYDPRTNTWQEVAPLPPGKSERSALGPYNRRDSGATATTGPDGRIYVVGGVFHRVVVAYTPGPPGTPGRWDEVAPMTQLRRWPLVATATDGHVYAMGGDDSNKGFYGYGLQTVEEYTPGPAGTAGTWKDAPSMPLARHSGAAVTASDNKTYALGGWSGPHGERGLAASGSAESYDPGERQWSPAPPMSQPRTGFGAAPGLDGRIYSVAGLAEGLVSTNTAEAFAPCASTWEPIAPLSVPRGYVASAADHEGRVYAFGGLTQVTLGGSVLESAEVYTPAAPIVPHPACSYASVGDVEVSEPKSGEIDALFTVSLQTPAVKPVTVNFQTEDGTAVAPFDYKAVSGILQFKTGEQSKVIRVPVESDDLKELDEIFAVKISGVSSGGVLRQRSTGTILDSPPAEADPSVPPSASIGDLTVPEPYNQTAPAVFTLTLDKPAPQDLTFSYKTEEGSATEGADYQQASGNVVI